MKVALCFIISYEHVLNKETIWRKWIQENEDLINVYFYYQDIQRINSEWILKHCIPPECIFKTSYFHVIPAYMSLLSYAVQKDPQNQWFCMLTDSCCPIISPQRFRFLFYENHQKSILKWSKSWWNVHLHKRANLRYLPEEFHLGNDPWFILKRSHVQQCIQYMKAKKDFVKLICDAGLANESLFAIMLYGCNQLNKKEEVINSSTHATDWTRMTSSTSPYLFKEVNPKDIAFIENMLNQDNENNYIMFIRKIAPEFPDHILEHYLYSYSKEKDDQLVIENPEENKEIKKNRENIVLMMQFFIIIYVFIFFIHIFNTSSDYRILNNLQR